MLEILIDKTIEEVVAKDTPRTKTKTDDPNPDWTDEQIIAKLFLQPDVTAEALAECHILLSVMDANVGEADRLGTAAIPMKDIFDDYLAGKPYAVNFMFTSCPSACPPLAKASQDLQTRIKAWSPQTPYEAHIVTISVDPETDTPEKLAQFGATYQADNALWKMARLSSYREMEDLVTKGFYLPIMRRDLMKATNEEERLALLKQPTPLDTAHGVDFMLVDRDGHIRGRYKKDAQGLDQLNAALKHLAGQ